MQLNPVKMPGDLVLGMRKRSPVGERVGGSFEHDCGVLELGGTLVASGAALCTPAPHFWGVASSPTREGAPHRWGPLPAPHGNLGPLIAAQIDLPRIPPTQADPTESPRPARPRCCTPPHTPRLPQLDSFRSAGLPGTQAGPRSSDTPLRSRPPGPRPAGWGRWSGKDSRVGPVAVGCLLSSLRLPGCRKHTRPKTSRRSSALRALVRLGRPGLAGQPGCPGHPETQAVHTAEPGHRPPAAPHANRPFLRPGWWETDPRDRLRLARGNAH